MTVQTQKLQRNLDRTLAVGPASGVALLLGLALLGLIFREEAAAAVGVWYDSTAYSHCFFVIPIAAYLAWDRRADLVGVPIVPAPWAVLAAVPLGLAWIAAERLGIMEGRQLVAMTLVEVLFLAVLGWRMCWALAAPLLYLYFLVPFGAFVTPVLQNFTARFIDVGLTVLGIPFNSDGFIIEIPEGRFYVAEACAGLRFLIASIAFGALYAVLMYRSWGRRVAFLAASIAIPVVANGLRALGIVVLGHILGSAQAAAADHLIYGWIFFSVVILLLILAGLPFRQDPAPGQQAALAVPEAAPQPGMRPSLFCACLVSLVAAVGPTGSLLLDRAARIQIAVPAVPLMLPNGCLQLPLRAGQILAADTAALRFRCGGTELTATLWLFPPRANPSHIVAAQRAATGEIEAGDSSVTSLVVAAPHMPAWRVVTTEEPARVTATGLWVDGRPAASGLAGRFALARNSVTGAQYAPAMLAIGTPPGAPQIAPGEALRIRDLIAALLRVQPDLGGRMERLARAAAAGQATP